MFGSLLRNQLESYLARLADRLDAGAEQQARARGWTVEHLPGGGRCYRDPRLAVQLAQRHQPERALAGAGRAR